MKSETKHKLLFASMAIFAIMAAIAYLGCRNLLYNGKKHTMTFQLHFFEETFQRLKSNFFIRVGRSLIVNKNYIYLINLTEQKMILTGGKLGGEYEVKASKDALKAIKTKLEEDSLPSWQKGGNS